MPCDDDHALNRHHRPALINTFLCNKSRNKPWCAKTTIQERSDDQVIASIVLKKGLINQTFTTRNTLQEANRIEMNLVDGPFSELHGVWQFKQLTENSCKISLEMKFAISNPMLRLTLEPVFSQVLGRLVDAFKDRAEELYG